MNDVLLSLAFGIENAVVYTDRFGDTKPLRIVPVSLWFGTADEYREPQWLLEACIIPEMSESKTLSLAALRPITKEPPCTPSS